MNARPAEEARQHAARRRGICAFFVVAIASFALLGAGAGSAGAMTLTNPVDGQAFKSPPVDYRGEASLNILVYVLHVQVRIRKDDESGPFVAYRSDILDIDGDFNVHAANLLRLPLVKGETIPVGTPLPDGKYHYRAIQRCVLCILDPLGAFGLDDNTAAATFWIDSAEPDTTIDSATPPSPTNSTTRTFEFHGDDPAPSSGITFECKLDEGEWEACTSPFATPVLSDGNHTFEVRAVDKAGNQDPTPATSSWMLDTTPPEITLTRPASREHFFLHESVTPAYSCSDPLAGGPPPVASGVSSCVDEGFDTHPLGPALFTVNAIDHAGNTAAVTHSYVIDPPDYGDFVHKDGPLAYYRFNEPLDSGEMLDSSGNHHDGIYQNGIALRRDGATSCERRPHPPRACELAHPAESKAAYFPPRDGHGYVNGISAPTHAYTMEAWVKPRDGADMMIMGHGGGGQLFISAGRLAFRQTQDTVHSTGAVPPGQWSHVAATWDGHDTYLYVDGVQVAHSSAANKPPSGTSTFYIGYGEMAPWFHGTIDEAAYYDSAVSAHMLYDHYEIGTAFDRPSIQAGNSPFNTAGPNTDPAAPKNGGLYAPAKVPTASFSCMDPDDAPGNSDIAGCTATVDGSPIADGDPLPNGYGPHDFVVTATDKGGNTYVHTHTYAVKDFDSLYNTDDPTAYYRLGDPSDSSTMADSSAHHRDGAYRNGTESGPVGIAGDGDHARRFTGADGYGYVNGLQAPQFQSSLVAWVSPDATANASIAGHGDAGELFIRTGTYRYRRMGETVDSGVAPTPGQWQQIVATWDGVDIKVYVDGVAVGSAESTKRPSSSSTFYVGYGELEPWFSGSIDEVAYYPVGLTPARVYQLWLADPPADLSAGGTGDGSKLLGDGAPSGTGAKSGAHSAASHTSAAPSSSSAPRAASTALSGAVGKTRCAALPGARRARCTRRAQALARCQRLAGAARKGCTKRARRIGRGYRWR